MGNLAGWGRYRTEAYPGTGPSGGGGGAAIVPLQRQRFIDGDTPQTGLNGAAAEPFKTIAQFMAARGNDSVADADANFVGWVMPALGGYTGNVAFPPYVTTELRADSISNTTVSGTVINGNITWPNVGPAAFTATGATLAMHNLTVIGSLTVTDDANAPSSLLVFGGDELGRQTSRLTGGFVSNTTQKLVEVVFYNAQIEGDVNCGTGIANAILVLTYCSIEGDIFARSLSCSDTFLDTDVITLAAGGGGAVFVNTQFDNNTILTSVAGAQFDGPSWQSFVSVGGTRGAGTFVLVTGGYDGGDAPGAALTGASTSVSLNGTGATAGFTGENSGNHYTTSNGTPTTVTLLTGGGEVVGDTMLITKTDLGANVLAVVNGGTGAGTIGTIPTISKGFVLARFNGTDWVFAEGGSLLA